MTTTPRTDAAIIAADGRWTYELKEKMQAIERELNAANQRIRQLEKQTLDDTIELGKLDAANERIRQLESILSERLIASYAPELLKKDNQ